MAERERGTLNEKIERGTQNVHRERKRHRLNLERRNRQTRHIDRYRTNRERHWNEHTSAERDTLERAWAERKRGTPNEQRKRDTIASTTERGGGLANDQNKQREREIEGKTGERERETNPTVIESARRVESKTTY